MNSFDIKVKKHSEGYKSGAIDYTHPSYGMVTILRTQGSTDLFGEDINANAYITLRVSQATVSQDLGRNWYHDNEVVTEVRMSQIQFAELMTGVNSQGVPCTISIDQKHGKIEYAAPESKLHYVESKVEETFSDLERQVKELHDTVKALLDGTVKKADKEAILSGIASVSNKLGSSLPFYKEKFGTALNELKSSAKADVQATLLHEVTKAGYKAIETSEGVFQLESLKQRALDKPE